MFTVLFLILAAWFASATVRAAYRGHPDIAFIAGFSTTISAVSAVLTMSAGV